MEHIKIKQVSKFFGDFQALKNINLTINQGEFFTLLGPSGCGKTTLLRTLAGFNQQEEGDIFFGEKNIKNVPAYKRNIGMVFQNYAIFPHLTVFQNVAYGLKARKVSKSEIKNRVQEALNMVELGNMGDRQPSELSGGQQQRVALARTIVIHPGLLLMDEPLSNLDAKLRIKMREDIRELQKKLNITTIYVTHDQEEALAVSDRIAVLNEGVVQQVGKPHEIYLSPSNKFVANFIGSTNFIYCEAKTELDETIIHIENVNIRSKFHQPYNGKVLYSIRPEQVRLYSKDNQQDSAWIDGEIINVTFLGESVVYKIKFGNDQVISAHEHSIIYHNLRKIGDKVKVDLNPPEAVIFDENGEGVLNEHKNLSNNETYSISNSI